MDFLGWIFSAGALVFLGYTLAGSAHLMPAINLNVAAVATLSASLIFWMMNQALGFQVWRMLLRGVGVQLAYRDSFVIVGKAQVGKYLPGNVFQYVGRTIIAGEYGLPVDTVAASMGMEIVVALMAAGVIVAAGIMFKAADLSSAFTWLSGAVAGDWQVYAVLLSGLAIIGVLGSATPTVRRWIEQHRGFFNVKNLTQATFYTGIFFAGIGYPIRYLMGGLWGRETSVGGFDLSVRFTIAWLAGFVLPGAPGGLGVREAVMLLLFRPLYGDGLAAGLGVVMRVISTIADLGMFGIASVMSKGRSRPTISR